MNEHFVQLAESLINLYTHKVTDFDKTLSLIIKIDKVLKSTEFVDYVTQRFVMEVRTDGQVTTR